MAKPPGKRPVKDPGTGTAHSLRERAEALLRATPRSLARLAPDDLIATLHELQVHQMELELQNEDLRQTQVALAQTRDRYTDLYEFSPVGYLTIAADGKIVEANLTAARLLDCDRRALLGQLFGNFVAAHFQDSLFRHWLKVFESEERQSIELQLLPAAGPAAGSHPRVVELQCVRGLQPVGGQPDCRAALVDVTGRKAAEAALRQWNGELEQRVSERTSALQESERSLADFFGRAPIGLLQVDPAGQIERANRAQLEILGLERDQVEGKPVYDFHSDRGEVQALIDALAQGQEIHNHRGRLRGGLGRVRHVLIDANGLWKDQTLVHTRWFVRDITPRLDLESAILAIAERERERVGHELHDDLCQQLTAIECMHDSLVNSWHLADPAAAKLAGEITAGLRKALEHTRDLARGLSPAIHLGPDGLASALKDLADLSRRVFKRDCQFLGSDPGPIDDPTMRVHLFRIAQEAVSNAIKHSGASRIEIELRADESNLTLAIRDNGMGLPGKLTGEKGMGLKIAQYRAAMINGTIEFRSQRRGGTAVICTVSKSGALT